MIHFEWASSSSELLFGRDEALDLGDDSHSDCNADASAVMLRHYLPQLLIMVVYCDVTPKLAVHFNYQHCVETIEYHASDGKPSLL